VLGNTRDRFDPLPVEARTMAERFHDGGYRTGVFVSNPWAGSFSSLQRGVDVFRDEGADPHGTSSVVLHRGFWNWRTAYPGSPYWAHFQTTDVHYDHHPVAPFAGLYATPELRKRYDRWKERIDEWHSENSAPFWERFLQVWDATGIDRVEYHDAMRALYDESMAHQDHQLGRFVQRLKDEGEWENTILVVTADHSLDAGTWDFVWFGQDSLPRPWNWSLLRASVSRVPLIFIWPGHIAGERVIRQPVSLIDVLPTLLDLTGLPMPEAMQGQSLTPLLLGRDGWEPRPVIFDQFETDTRTGELLGTIEVIDGRWGASLMIGPEPEDDEQDAEWRRRPDELLLYDVWNDPFALTPVNEEQPDLVEQYRAFLEDQWAAHRALAQHFTPGGETELTPEQLETLRSLGYIQ
jgi:arylsulfatase A-like enzyme